MDFSVPKKKFFKPKVTVKKTTNKKKHRPRIRRGFQIHTKEGKELEKNLEEVVNRDITEHRLIPQSKIDSLLKSLSKSRSGRTNDCKMQLKSQKIKTEKSMIIDLSKVNAVTEIYKKERALVAKSIFESKTLVKKTLKEDEEDDEVEDED